MRLFRSWLLLVGVALICAGCEPVNRIVWSPDGQRAAVLASDGLRLCERDGHMSRPLIPAVDVACWTPDSNHALLAIHSRVQTWSEAAKLLAPQERKQALEEAGQLRKAILSYKGSWDDFLKENDALLNSFKFPTEATLYLREKHPDELKSKLKDKWSDMEKLSLDVWDVQSHELSPSRAAGGSSVYRTNRAVVDIRIPRHGRAVAVVEQARVNADEGLYQISVVPIEGGVARRITQQGAKCPDWSEDGRLLVYTEVAGSAQGSLTPALGSLKEVEICQPSGELLKDFKAARTLAYVPFAGAGRVRCLQSGRIVFSSAEIALPCTEADASSLPTLYVLDPNKQATATRLVPRGTASEIAHAAHLFEISADESMASVPSHSGVVTVLNIKTGEVTKVQPEIDAACGRLIFIPQWRSADELCFAAPAQKGAADKWVADVVVMNIKTKAKQILNKGWPSEAVAGFLRESAAAGLPSQ